MSRNSFWMVALLPGLVACGSTAQPGSTNGGTGDGGDGGQVAVNGACSAPDDTQGPCPWPEFCLQGHCTAPQNLSATGDPVPSNACVTSGSTVQGSGNLDLDRSEEDAGLELLAPSSPIIIDLTQVPIQSDADCVTWIGHNTVEYQESAKACLGGNSDTVGKRPICADKEAAVLFQGDVYDPAGHFPTKEGLTLDTDFWWMTTVEQPINFTAQAFGAAQSGFIMPSTGWTKFGGHFVMAQCLDKKHFPSELNAYPVTLHFADTSGGEDGGYAGNSFCTQWSPL